MNYLIGYFTFLVGFNDLRIIHQDSGEYHKKDLKSPEVNIFGCDPYKNVWSKLECRAPDLSKTNYRTCGFHIHVGYESTSKIITKEIINKYLVKSFDMFVVLPSYLIHFDKRRSLAYGGLGQYREKYYGVECRSLGGYFTHPERLSWVWNNLMKAIDFCNYESNLEILDGLKVLEELEEIQIKEYLNTFHHELILV